MSDRYESVTYPPVAFEDGRGTIVNVLAESLVHVAVITSKSGAVRANHWHPRDRQHQFVVSGRLRAVSAPVDEAGRRTGPSRELIVEAGALLYTPPLVGHAYEFLSDAVLVNLNTVDRRPEEYEAETRPLVEPLIP